MNGPTTYQLSSSSPTITGSDGGDTQSSHSIQMMPLDEMTAHPPMRNCSSFMDIGLFAALNGYIAGYGLSMVASFTSSSLDIGAGTGILLMNVLYGGHMIRKAVESHSRQHGRCSIITNFALVTGIAATLGCLANFNHHEC